MKKNKDVHSSEANTLIGAGVGVGIYGAALASVTGAVCPMCVIAAPGLLAAGSYKKWKSSQTRKVSPDDDVTCKLEQEE